MSKPSIRVPANASGPIFTADGFVNFVSRLGTPGDKAAYGSYAMPTGPLGWMNRLEIDAAYRTSVFRKICDVPPNDEVREWRAWAGAEQDQLTPLDDEEKRLGLRGKLEHARKLARKDGGSAIIIGVNGNPSTPLRPESVSRGGLKFLTVLSRYEITAGEKERDALSPYFGQPKTYYINSETRLEVHPSRVIRFVGNPILDSSYWDGWGESIWINLRDGVSRVDQISAGVSSMVEEAKVDVIKIKGLMAGMATAEYESAMVRRWAALNLFKSMNSALLLDADDEFDSKTLTFQGLSDIQIMAMTILSGMADIPATRLWGRAPQGMNATGDSDMRNYYDRIAADQELTLRPALAVVDECLIRSALGERPPEVYYEWNPLYTMTDKEKADVEKVYADATAVYVNTGVIPDSAMAAMTRAGIVERGNWSGAESAFRAAEADGDEPGLLAEPSEAEIAAEEARTAIARAQAADPAGFGAQRPKLVAANDARFTDATPRSLYVRRDVLNQAEIKRWAKSQGFRTSLDDMHVTITYSRGAVDWMQMGEPWESKLELPEGGPRVVEPLGPKGAIVLFIAARDLAWRHRSMVERGATYDFEDYQPHITITYDRGEVDIGKVEPYRGKIVLGPEIFEELKTGDVEHEES